MERVLLLTSDV